MFVHVFSFVWKDAASDANKTAALIAVKALAEQIEELDIVHVGQNVSDNAPEYELTGVMLFADENAYKRYTTHPAHLALLEWLVPLIDAIELDFTAA